MKKPCHSLCHSRAAPVDFAFASQAPKLSLSAESVQESVRHSGGSFADRSTQGSDSRKRANTLSAIWITGVF
jgi:hypothetical protein